MDPANLIAWLSWAPVVIFAMLLLLLLTTFVAWRMTAASFRQLEQIVAVLAAQKHQSAIERFRDESELHHALTRLLADAFGRPTQLVPGSLSCAALPAPFLSTTRVDGARIYLTQEPRRLRRLGLVRGRRRTIAVTRGATARRSDMHAIWEAVSMRTTMPQPALPAHRDWYALLLAAYPAHQAHHAYQADR